MDVDNLLNLERRTGIKNDDIDDFTRKATDVQNAIRDMLDGKIEPENVKIEGIDSPEEVIQKEQQRQARLKKQAKEAEELVVGVQRREASQEKKERWWSGAAMDIFKDKNRQFIRGKQ